MGPKENDGAGAGSPLFRGWLIKASVVVVFAAVACLVPYALSTFEPPKSSALPTVTRQSVAGDQPHIAPQTADQPNNSKSERKSSVDPKYPKNAPERIAKAGNRAKY